MISRRSMVLGSLLAGVSAVSTATGNGILSPKSIVDESSGAGTWLGSDEGTVFVEIEPNGWVARVTGIWPKSNFTSFVLDPEGSPKFRLLVRSFGFDRGSGLVSACERVREILGTVPLRVSEAGPPIDLASLDEKLLPDGRRQVRIALSEYVYSTDEIVQITLASGWRTGLIRSTVGGWANSSLATPEMPSMRWIVPTLMRATREHAPKIEMIVASGLTVNRQAVAGVRFTATDGVGANSVWVAEPTFSEDWGDRLRVWSVDPVDLCDGLNPGPITVHAEVYPWIGRMRATGSGHSNSIDQSLALGAEKPLIVLWDPEGDHLPEAHVYVSSQGSRDPALVTVSPNFEGARSGVHAADISVAVHAIFLANRHISPANGWPGASRAGDNAVITLGAGSHGLGRTNTPAGATTIQGRLVLRGDPDVPDQAVTLRLGDQPIWRFRFLELRDLVLEIGGARFPVLDPVVHLQDVHVRARPGFESSFTFPFSGKRTEGRLTIIGGSWLGTNANLRTDSMRCSFVRSATLGVSTASPVIIGCTHRGQQGRGFDLRSIVGEGIPEATDDTFICFNEIFRVSSRPVNLLGREWNQFPGSRLLLRLRLFNNLFEMCPPAGHRFDGTRTFPAGEPFFTIGENSFTSLVDSLVEGNTFVGQRVNIHNDPPTTNPDYQLRHTGNVIRNNFFDRNDTKHDKFQNPRFGRRPGFTASWSLYYGVCRQNNVTSNRMGPIIFPYAFLGIGQVLGPNLGTSSGNSWTRFLDDRSQLGLSPLDPGNGDYRPAPGSPLLGRGRNATTDVDVRGKLRSELFSAGAYEA